MRSGIASDVDSDDDIRHSQSITCLTSELSIATSHRQFRRLISEFGQVRQGVTHCIVEVGEEGERDRDRGIRGGRVDDGERAREETGG